MIRPQLPLNALRAFEASARHLSFTRAAVELCVTQAAVSHQVKSLESQLGVTLFKRLPRGLLLTSEGETLLPVLRESFDRIAQTLERFEGGHFREVLTVGAVGTFAVGWLLPRLADFQAKHPFLDLRLSTNNNRATVRHRDHHRQLLVDPLAIALRNVGDDGVQGLAVASDTHGLACMHFLWGSLAKASQASPPISHWPFQSPPPVAPDSTPAH